MPYGTITGSISGQTFEPRSPGVYALSTLTFADPQNEFRITGASVKRDGSLSGSITRVLQKDVVVGNSSVRKGGFVTLNVSIPNDGSITAEEVDTLTADISLFVTSGNMSRLLQRES